MSQLDYSQFTPVEIDGLEPNNIYLIKTPNRDEIVKYIDNDEKYNFYLLHFGNFGNNNKWTDKFGKNNTIKYTKSDLIKHPIYDLEDYKDLIENGDIKSIEELMYDNSRFDAAQSISDTSPSNVAFRLSNSYASGSGTSAASGNSFNIGDLKEYGIRKKKTSNSNRLSNFYHFSNSKSGSKSGVSKGGRKKSLKRSSKKMKKSKKSKK